MCSSDLGLNILSYVKDLALEITKTNKQIESIQKIIDTISIQLNNPQFTSRAEQEVIDQKNQDLRDRQTELQKQKDKLAILKQ